MSNKEWQEKKHDEIVATVLAQGPKHISPHEKQAKRLAECALDRLCNDEVFQVSAENIVRERLGRGCADSDSYIDEPWYDEYNELQRQMAQAMLKYLLGEYL